MNSGIIAEHYVLCELLRLGYTALPHPNPTNPDWDIAIERNNGQLLKFQIKAIDWKTSTSKVVSGNFAGNFDYLVLVIINYYRTQKYAVFVIPKAHLARRANQKQGLFCNTSQHILFTNNTITFSTFKTNAVRAKLNKNYRNKWP